MSIAEIVKKSELGRQDIIDLLSINDPLQTEILRSAAEELLLALRGNKVYFRGLVEFSNVCTCDCYYCGIRRSNTEVKRYSLTKEEIINSALWCADQGYGSVVLQSGERSDEQFTDFIEDVVSQIKQKSISPRLPKGLGITLCVGEQAENVYKRWYEAGAHRYLLRIESSTDELFRKIHPENQKLENRKRCLELLKKTGYKTGTGVMIGLPGQTIENLADDILFFRSLDIDMIGMGPYIVHKQTPMAVHFDDVQSHQEEIFALALRMIAVTRLALRNVNIASTTALQSMKPDGREQGLLFGANVIMPQVTPVEVRRNYLLYENKPCLDENAEQCRNCLTRRIESIGRVTAPDTWGDRPD